MNFPFFIARRYLFSKKSTHVINVISSVSVIGVAVATMALVIVLSVFNGFHDLVASLFTSFDPQLKVMLKGGKDGACRRPDTDEDTPVATGGRGYGNRRRPGTGYLCRPTDNGED